MSQPFSRDRQFPKAINAILARQHPEALTRWVLKNIVAPINGEKLPLEHSFGADSHVWVAEYTVCTARDRHIPQKQQETQLAPLRARDNLRGLAGDFSPVMEAVPVALNTRQEYGKGVQEYHAEPRDDALLEALPRPPIASGVQTISTERSQVHEDAHTHHLKSHEFYHHHARMDGQHHPDAAYARFGEPLHVATPVRTTRMGMPREMILPSEASVRPNVRCIYQPILTGSGAAGLRSSGQSLQQPAQDQIQNTYSWTAINTPSQGPSRGPHARAGSPPIAGSNFQGPGAGNQLHMQRPGTSDVSIFKNRRGLFAPSPAIRLPPNRPPLSRAHTTPGTSTSKPRPKYPRRPHCVLNPPRDINHQVRTIVLTDATTGETVRLIDDDDYDPPTAYRKDDITPADFARAAVLGKLRCTRCRRWRPMHRFQRLTTQRCMFCDARITGLG